MNQLQLDLNELTINEAVLFAFRYRLIDDCQPEGGRYRLSLGNQSILLSQSELARFLHTLLLQYQRSTEDSPAGTPIRYGRG